MYDHYETGTVVLGAWLRPVEPEPSDDRVWRALLAGTIFGTVLATGVLLVLVPVLRMAVAR